MKKRIVSAILLLILIFNILPVNIPYGDTFFVMVYAATEPPQLKSESAILMDAESGRVIFEKDCDVVLYPASTTKIMTAILVFENLQPDTVVTASRQAIESIPVGGSNMGLIEGEQLTVEQLMYGVLLLSANEACNVLAEHMCGDTEAFVALMNKKAAELGMTNTNYLNTNGLHTSGHYSTARDLAILAQYAMQNDKFRDMVATTKYMIEPTEKYAQERRMYNTNYLVSSNLDATYYYPKAIGIKTGYTSQAGNCLVSAAAYDGMEFIAVTLKADPQPEAIYSFVDSKALLEYGFENYKRKIVVEQETQLGEAQVGGVLDSNYASLYAAEEFSAILKADQDIDDLNYEILLNEDIRAPIKDGDVLGVAIYSYDGTVLGSVDLITHDDIRSNVFVFLVDRIFEFLSHSYINAIVSIFITYLS